eukprot:CFRG3410T1
MFRLVSTGLKQASYRRAGALALPTRLTKLCVPVRTYASDAEDLESLYITAPLTTFENESLQKKRTIHNRRITGRTLSGGMLMAARLLGVYSKSSTNIRIARIQYELCAEQSSEQFITACNLPDTFYSWWAVTHLHVWMCMCRNAHIRESANQKIINKNIYDIFQEDIAARISAMGITDAIEVKKRTNQLIEMFWGAVLAYDEGLLYEDSTLAAALWRNMYGCTKDVPITQIAELVSYIRRETLRLDNTVDNDIMLGIVYFDRPKFLPKATVGH